jgi:hypothetical protein
LHKNEVLPSKGKSDDDDTRYITANLSPYPSYLFGQDENIKYHVRVNSYPLNTAEDLQFEEEHYPLFGI